MSKTFDAKGLEQLDAKLATISPEECHNIMLKAVTSGASTLKNLTKESLTTKMGAKATSKLKGRNVSLVDGVKMSKDKTLCEAKVYLTGFSGWFELGTDIRQTGKGYNRGKITGLNYFFSARQRESEVTDSIFQTLQSNLDRILK